MVISKKVNIDIGTNILKQKCFGHKTNVFNTHSNFHPAKNYLRIALYPLSIVPWLQDLDFEVFPKICMRPSICRLATATDDERRTTDDDGRRTTTDDDDKYAIE